MSTFTYAGVSTDKGVTKVRFANDAFRVKHLAKVGHSDIDMIELKHAMTKDEAVAFLISIDFATARGVTNQRVKAALEEAQEKRAPNKAGNRDAPKKEAKKPKKDKPKSTPSLDAIAARGRAAEVTITKAEIVAQMTDNEDAPC